MVVGQVHKAAKLTTTQFTVDKIVHGTKTKKLAWFVSLNEARFLAYSRAIIKTGIDLEKVKKEDIEISGNSITLTLPPVQIINFSYPPELFSEDEYISGNAFLNKITVEDQENFFRDAEIDIRNNLKYMGIIETTEKNTKILLKTMLQSIGYEDIHIEFKKGALIEEIPFTEQLEK